MTTPTRRGTSNTNVRGSAKDRRARKEWMLLTFDEDLGPAYVRCYECRTVLDWDTMQVDRIIPGVKGGRYTRDNIRPACGQCNIVSGVLVREEIHRETCGGRCRRCRLVSEYRAARHAAELARESACAGYAAEEAAYGALITFRDWLIASAGPHQEGEDA